MPPPGDAIHRDSRTVEGPSSAGRILTLDILRGFALLGMIVVHFHQSFRTTTPGLREWPGEGAVGWIVWWGIEQKAMAVFAFLFGVGFAIVMRGAEARGQPVTAFYLRRLAGLAVIGAALEVSTGYAILVHYAIWGVPLLFVRSWSSRALLILALVAAIAGSVITFGIGAYDRVTTGQATTPRANTAAGAPTYAAEVAQRFERLQRQIRWSTLIPGWSFVLFILGLLSVRHRVFDEPRTKVRVIVTAMVLGAVSWLLYWLLLPKMPPEWWKWSPDAWHIRYGMGLISDQWLAFTYMGALVLLIAYRPVWSARLAWIGIAGRMALTNYILQAVAIYYLASRFGLGLRLRPYYYILGALVLFLALVLFSHAWLARFRYGPLEVVWRTFAGLGIPAKPFHGTRT